MSRPTKGKTSGGQDETTGAQVVGHLWPTTDGKHAVVGTCCCIDGHEALQEPVHGVPVFWVNVYPYRQNCAKCGKVLVDGAAGWPVLFDGKL